MDIEIPDWMTNDFIKTALENDETSNKNEIVIEKTDVKRAVPKGTNYMCDLYRVKIDYFDKTGDKLEAFLIIKSPITGGLFDVISKFGIIQKEAAIYKEFQPKLSQIVEDDLMAKPLRSIQENVIILEDLNFHGYKMANRLDQLDYKHCEFALTALGKFHAASIKTREDYPGLVERIGKESLFRGDLKQENDYLVKSQLELLTIELSNWPELVDYVDRLKSLADKMWDLLADCMEPKDNRFNLLNHGDFWLTNMLFKYNSINELDKVKFIDLQLSRYTTPAIDLIYFMHGSAQEDVRVKHFNELINVYLKSLNENLERLKCKTKNLEERELLKELNECQFYEFYTSITLLPVVLYDTKDVLEIKEMSDKDINEDIANNPFRKYLQSKTYRQLFTKRFLNEFSKQKWFVD